MDRSAEFKGLLVLVVLALAALAGLAAQAHRQAPAMTTVTAGR